VPGSVLLVEENGVHRENHGPVTSHWQTLSHNVVFYVYFFYCIERWVLCKFPIFS
jgi:hypothetical protein